MRRDEVESLYERYCPALLAYASAILHQRAAAEDILHQVFLNLMKSAVAMPDHPKAYLYRAVGNGALNARRNLAREFSGESNASVEWNSNEAWFVARPGVLEKSGANEVGMEEALELQAALLEIPEEQREIIVMKIWGEMTYEEIALVAEVSANTAASRYRYGLSKLRERMAPSEVNLHAEKSDDQFEQYLRQFEPSHPRPLPEVERDRATVTRWPLAIAALIVVACGLVLWWKPPLVHEIVIRSYRTDISDPPIPAATLSLGRLNRLIWDDPRRLDAVLSEVSPGILPDVMQPNGSLYALAKD